LIGQRHNRFSPPPTSFFAFPLSPFLISGYDLLVFLPLSFFVPQMVAPYIHGCFSLLSKRLFEPLSFPFKCRSLVLDIGQRTKFVGETGSFGFAMILGVPSRQSSCLAIGFLNVANLNYGSAPPPPFKVSPLMAGCMRASFCFPCFRRLGNSPFPPLSFLCRRSDQRLGALAELDFHF